MKTPVLNMLKEYKNNNRIRFAMPGDKSRRNFLPEFSSFSYGATELYDTDNLYCAKGKEFLESDSRTGAEIIGLENDKILTLTE